MTGRRGLLTRVVYRDTRGIDAVEVKYTYNSSGSLTSMTNPKGLESRLEYTDDFADGMDRNALAFATRVTTNGVVSAASYDFGTGKLARRSVIQSDPKKNRVRTFRYDTAGRLIEKANLTTGVVAKISFDPDGAVQTTTVSRKEFTRSSISVRDGVGRVRAFADSNPASPGGYQGAAVVRNAFGTPLFATNILYFDAAWRSLGRASVAKASHLAKLAGVVGSWFEATVKANEPEIATRTTTTGSTTTTGAMTIIGAGPISRVVSRTTDWTARIGIRTVGRGPGATASPRYTRNSSPQAC